MGWRTVVVNVHAKLTYQNNHLIFKRAADVEQILISEIDILLIETTDITISTMLIKRLMDENVLVIFCDDKRLPKARLEAYSGRHDSSMQLSRQLLWDEERKAAVWTAIINQKITNQGRFLKQIGAVKKADAIFRLASELTLLDETNREGHAARLYFQALFGKAFSRKMDNSINAGLDYGYSLIMSMFARELVVTGCMTQFGLKHANQFNEFNLASDLMEPFRPLVDIVVYERQNDDFPVIKRALLSLFDQTYGYNNGQIFLSNIVTDYTKKVVKTLNHEQESIPEFWL